MAAERPSSIMQTVIADDEKLAREELTYLLEEYPDVELVGVAGNGLKALELIEQVEPDLAILDVQMPGLDGLSVIRKVREKNPDLPYFVLATAHEHYAVEAFALDAMDYLLKPFEKSRLGQSIERARRAIDELRIPAEATAQPVASNAKRSKLLVKHQNRYLIVDSDDIVYFRIENGQIAVIAEKLEGASSYKTIEELQSELDPAIFWRAHRSYLVNIHKIREVIPWFKSTYQLKMDDRAGSTIPVSRFQTKRLRELFRM